MRDNVLVQAQTQLDSLAATMAQALSDTTVGGSTAASGAQTGFGVDTTGLLNGNRIHLTYTDTATNTQHQVSIVRVDDPSTLPLSNTFTADPNDEVFGVDFSGGLSSVVSQLNAQFGPGLQFTNPSGAMLQVLDDGVTNTTDVNALSVTKTATALAGGTPARSPVHRRGERLYSDAIDGKRLRKASASPGASPSTRCCWAIPPSSRSTTRPRPTAIRRVRTSSTIS